MPFLLPFHTHIAHKYDQLNKFQHFEGIIHNNNQQGLICPCQSNSFINFVFIHTYISWLFL